jgi:hypothetical protein
MFNNSKKKVLRSLVKDMRWFIGSTPCSCVESDIEKDYQYRLSQNKTAEERMLWSIANEAPEPEESVISECERCTLLGRYEEYYGPDLCEAEWNDTMAKPLTEEQKTALIQALVAVQSRLNNKEENK